MPEKWDHRPETSPKQQKKCGAGAELNITVKGRHWDLQEMDTYTRAVLFHRKKGRKRGCCHALRAGAQVCD